MCNGATAPGIDTYLIMKVKYGQVVILLYLAVLAIIACCSSCASKKYASYVTIDTLRKDCDFFRYVDYERNKSSSNLDTINMSINFDDSGRTSNIVITRHMHNTTKDIAKAADEKKSKEIKYITQNKTKYRNNKSEKKNLFSWKIAIISFIIILSLGYLIVRGRKA